jgi:hypothetical protein
MLTFKTLSLADALLRSVVCDVELNATTAVFPSIELTFTMFGAAIG